MIQIMAIYPKIKIMLTSFLNCDNYSPIAPKDIRKLEILLQGGDERKEVSLEESDFWNVMGLSWMLLWESKTRFLRLNAKEGER